MRHFVVLVVDSDWSTARFIRDGLESKDIRIIQAASALDCLKTISGDSIDLLLLDLDLPDFDGWAVLSLLRLSRHLQTLPIILLSTEAPNPQLIRWFRPEAYIRKPFDIPDLAVRVRTVLEDQMRPSIGSPDLKERLK